MIRIAISLDTFYRLQALTKGGFISQYKVYQDHADIDVDKEVMCELLSSLKQNETLDDVIQRGIKDRFRQDA